jgi:hypothetical protein
MEEWKNGRMEEWKNGRMEVLDASIKTLIAVIELEMRSARGRGLRETLSLGAMVNRFTPPPQTPAPRRRNL